MKTVVKYDRYRYLKNTESSWKAYGKTGFQFVYLMRICQHTSVYNPLGMISRLLYKFYQILYGFQIPHSTKIGKGFFLGHYGNIVINASSIIGDNCNIAQGVTIGQVNRGKNEGCPKIGNKVWIGANAVIVGNIQIGNNALIAPLSYVNFNVPENAVVMGNPATIVSDKGSGDYVNNILEDDEES